MPNWCENELTLTVRPQQPALTAEAENALLDAFGRENCVTEEIHLPVLQRLAFLMGARNTSAPRLAADCHEKMRELPRELIERIFELCTVTRRKSELSFAKAVPPSAVHCGVANWGTKWEVMWGYAYAYACAYAFAYACAYAYAYACAYAYAYAYACAYAMPMLCYAMLC
jgi:hypothetical protein